MFKIIRISSVLTFIHVLLWIMFKTVFDNNPIVQNIVNVMKAISVFPIKIMNNYPDTFNVNIFISNTMGLGLSFYGYVLVFATTFMFYLILTSLLLKMRGNFEN